jgi:hypothetical protein
MPTQSLTFSGNSNYITEQGAVSYLMKRCGDRLDMEYCSDGCSSSADTKDADYVFREFGYKDDMNYQRKAWHTYNAWVNMLKDEINAERPILYRYKGSHAFVCDGHDGDNTFHFNLGWNGYCDGWYDFEDLKVAGVFDYSDKSHHHCYINIRPNAGTNISLKNVSITTGASDPWPNKKTYQAKSTITTAGDGSYFIVNNNAGCRLVAGERVQLKPGFSAKNGSMVQCKVYKKPSLKSTSSPTYPESEKELLTISDFTGSKGSKGFSIYPNPTNNYLIVSGIQDTNTDIQITIHDLTGKVVHQYSGVFTGKYELNIKNIPNGIYSIRICCNQEVYSEKIIKQ